jgi:hypothetical protein
MPAWPDYLPDFVSADDYNEEWLDGVIRSETEVGPAKTRRVFTRMRRNVQRSFVVDQSLYDLFWDFIDLDLAGGVVAFTVSHPVTHVIMSLKLRQMPTATALGVNGWRITLQCEEQ